MLSKKRLPMPRKAERTGAKGMAKVAMAEVGVCRRQDCHLCHRSSELKSSELGSAEGKAVTSCRFPVAREKTEVHSHSSVVYSRPSTVKREGKGRDRNSITENGRGRLNICSNICFSF